jgi:hypothetical protein
MRDSEANGQPEQCLHEVGESAGVGLRKDVIGNVTAYEVAWHAGLSFDEFAGKSGEDRFNDWL